MFLPSGIEDFRELLENKAPDGENYLYVDKSLFIKDILYNGDKVIVITRPRRFGKTLNLSMLHYFFAREIGGVPTKGLFDGLNISQHADCMRYQGTLPVIFISFKDIKQPTVDLCIKKIRAAVTAIYKAHRKVLYSDKIAPDEKPYIDSVIQGTVDIIGLEESIKRLSGFLYDFYGTKPVVLFDEYDTPLQHAYLTGYYKEIISFMKNFCSATLKGNENISKAVLTGIVRVSQESLFSDLNNVNIYSVLNPLYSDAFGFSEKEVDTLFEKSGISADKTEIKSWYNGYQFSDKVIYNPWSIIKCLSERGETTLYWVNTSSNELMKKQIIKAEPPIKEKLSELIKGQTIEVLINEHFVFDDLNKNQTALWSLLLMSGYLTVVSSVKTEYGKAFTLKIPNKEVEVLYKNVIREWLFGGFAFQWHRDFLMDLTEGRMEDFEEKTKILVEESLSYHDTSKKSQESFYHGLMLGFVAGLKEQYEIKSNRESGRGRYDVAMFPKKENAVGIIMEFKATEEGVNFEKAAKLALKQIEDTGYDTEMRQRGIANIFKIGFGFSGKDFKMLWKKE